jgi:hypothetical protein
MIVSSLNVLLLPNLFADEVLTKSSYGLADGIVTCPHKISSHFEKWAQEAPGKTALWSSKVRRGLPKLLVVLEEWSYPTWTYVVSDEEGDDH